jgi:hypothetical protein
MQAAQRIAVSHSDADLTQEPSPRAALAAAPAAGASVPTVRLISVAEHFQVLHVPVTEALWAPTCALPRCAVVFAVTPTGGR